MFGCGVSSEFLHPFHKCALAVQTHFTPGRVREGGAVVSLVLYVIQHLPAIVLNSTFKFLKVL